MTDQAAQTFTVSVEAQYADELREARDRTDAEIAGDFFMIPASKRAAAVAKERGNANLTRVQWEREATESAVGRVVREFLYANQARHVSEDDEDSTLSLPTRDLEGITITVTITDLVATATLTAPQA